MIRKLNSIEGELESLKLDQYDLVLVDIDGVVISPTQYLCSSQWYVKYIADTDTDDRDTDFKDKISNDLYFCLNNSDFAVVEVELVNFLSELAKTNTVYGFTGRVPSFHGRTEYWLNKVGMEFTEVDSQVRNSDIGSMVHSGVIYVGHNPKTALPYNKGEILGKFLAEYDKEIKSVLFIDDFVKNLEHVEKYCSANGIDFDGIEYTRVKDGFEKAYTPEQLQYIAGVQYTKFFREGEGIPSDHDAFHSGLTGCTHNNNTLEFTQEL